MCDLPIKKEIKSFTKRGDKNLDTAGLERDYRGTTSASLGSCFSGFVKDYQCLDIVICFTFYFLVVQFCYALVLLCRILINIIII